MKKFLEAVIYGGVALFIGAFFGLFLEGLLEQYVPEDTNSTEYDEYQDSILSLMIDNFIPLWFLALLVGVVALVLSVSEVM